MVLILLFFYYYLYYHFFLLNKNIHLILSDQDSIFIASQILPLICITLFLSGLSGVYINAIKGIHLGYVSSYINILASIIQLTAVLFLVPRFGLFGLASAQLAQVIINLIFGWLIFCYITKENARQSKIPVMMPLLFSFKTVRFMFVYSLNNQIVKFSYGCIQPISKILISRFYGLEYLGIYEFGSKLIEITSRAISAAITALLPALTALSTKSNEEWQPTYNSIKKMAFFRTMVPYLMLLGFSPLISYIILENIDWDFIQIVVTLCCGYYFVSAFSPSYILGNAFGILRYQIYGALIGIIFLIISGSIIGNYLSPGFFLICISLSLFIRSVFVKVMNEKKFVLKSIE